jgi:IS30 family transposase
MTDRIRLEEKIKAGKSKQQAADELGFHVSTVYRELKRGTYEHLNSDYTTEIRYSPDIADERYRDNLKAKGAPIKLGNDYALADYIETKIADERYSPGAVLGEIKRLGLEFSVTISKPTLYRYIELGVFGRITIEDLPEKPKKKNTKRKVRVTRPPAGESIENRPDEVDTRDTFGHWEMDTIVSAGHAKETLLVLTERLTRYEFMLLMPDRTTASVVKALNRIEWKFGKHFPEIFKTITCDNGVEFSDCEGIEKKRRGKGKRTKVYYCHPYSSYERGSNENQNRMIRRWLPKGTSFASVSKEEVARIEAWLNNYPREIFDFETAAARFEGHLETIMAAA